MRRHEDYWWILVWKLHAHDRYHIMTVQLLLRRETRQAQKQFSTTEKKQASTSLLLNCSYAPHTPLASMFSAAAVAT